jgi:hypothetical protein
MSGWLGGGTEQESGRMSVHAGEWSSVFASD